jgi:hypothetical protein
MSEIMIWGLVGFVTLKVGNLINTINTYQNYKNNKNTMSLRG